MVTKQNCIHEEIKSRVIQGILTAMKFRVLSSCVLSKNMKFKIHKTIILPVVLCGCETLSLSLMEEHTLGAFESSVLRRIFGPKRNEVLAVCLCM
jgi:hypothetical protein